MVERRLASCHQRIVRLDLSLYIALILPPKNGNEVLGICENANAEERESSAMYGLHLDIFPSFIPKLIKFDIQVIWEG